MVALWKESLSQTSEKAARSLADPAEYDNLFPERPATLCAQQFSAQQRARPIPAHAAAKLPVNEHTPCSVTTRAGTVRELF